MADRIESEQPHPCSCGETHLGHICWLSRMDMLEEIRHLTDMPTVTCAKCGARANQPHNVCFPAPPEA